MMGRGAKLILPTCVISSLIKVQMKGSNVALLGGSDPRWSRGGGGRLQGAGWEVGGLAPWFEHRHRVHPNPQGSRAS